MKLQAKLLKPLRMSGARLLYFSIVCVLLGIAFDVLDPAQVVLVFYVETLWLIVWLSGDVVARTLKSGPTARALFLSIWMGGRVFLSGLLMTLWVAPFAILVFAGAAGPFEFPEQMFHYLQAMFSPTLLALMVLYFGAASVDATQMLTARIDARKRIWASAETNALWRHLHLRELRPGYIESDQARVLCIARIKAVFLTVVASFPLFLLPHAWLTMALPAFLCIALPSAHYAASWLLQPGPPDPHWRPIMR